MSDDPKRFTPLPVLELTAAQRAKLREDWRRRTALTQQVRELLTRAAASIRSLLLRAEKPMTDEGRTPDDVIEEADAFIERMWTATEPSKLMAEVVALYEAAENEHEQMQADLYAIGAALGIGAKPYSGHEAVERDFIPRIKALESQCQALREALARSIASFDKIAMNDATTYRHHQPRKFDGLKPSPGSCWLTPREIAEVSIERIKAALSPPARPSGAAREEP